MADYGVYWKNFARERKRQVGACTRWFTNSHLGRRAAPGDRLWLIANGNVCGLPGAQMGYLVQVLTVRTVERNDGRDAGYPSGDFATIIEGEPARCVPIEPPILIDHLVREEGQAPEMPFGTLHQNPWKLKDNVAARLIDHLRQERRLLFDMIIAEEQSCPSSACGEPMS
jgi:hypothetical protein